MTSGTPEHGSSSFTPPDGSTLDAVLRDRFGLTAFRPGQRAAIDTLFEHRRLLCIQPTGYGKSLLYQLPATLLPGMTMVISPLLALVRDQVGQLGARFGIRAVSINTDQSEAENEAAIKAATTGQARILFVAPERLDNLASWAFLIGLPVDLLVVDEAHCISTWGHDFRPSYRQIINMVNGLAERRSHLHVLGLTATADPRTEADIARQLAVHEGAPLKVLRAPMDRPNLALTAIPTQATHTKLAWLDAFVSGTHGCGILYCATREQTEIVAEYLASRGLPVTAYHAGLEPERKRQLQRDFLADTFRAIAATNALGMGIDKPDLRYIVHVDVPGSITAYYQEVGRAGRDGLPARGVLLYDPADRRIQKHFIRSAQPTDGDFQSVLDVVRPNEEGIWPNLQQIKILTGLHPTRVAVILAELREQGHVDKILIKGRQVYRAIEPPPATLDLTRYVRQSAVRTKELDTMLRYAEGRVACHMQTLRMALGDVEAAPCGRCGRCVSDIWAQVPHLAPPDAGAVETAREWLSSREVKLPAARAQTISSGAALFASEIRDPAFVIFMRHRAIRPPDAINGPAPDRLAPDTIELLCRKLDRLCRGSKFAGVVAVPSRTWAQRETTAQIIADHLGVPAWPQALSWRVQPAARQGELLNNDQRRHNVRGHMAARLPSAVPADLSLLLLDDYTGSAATLREAARALRKQARFEGGLVPLTIARVRWRLGARGII